MIGKIFISFVAAAVFLCINSPSCTTNNGGGNGSSTSSGTTTYSFESVKLFYDFSNSQNSWAAKLLDAGDLHQAHSTDPSAFSGSINSLSRILEKSDNYIAERKPKVEIIINSFSDGDTTFVCTKDDVSDTYVQNIPDYGCQIQSLIVKVQSIMTPSNNLILRWEKTFDLQGEWWSLNSSRILEDNATITVGGYTKYAASNEVIIVRVRNGEYQVNTYLQPDVLEVSGLDCDVEFVTTPATSSPTLEQPIYNDGNYDELLLWDEPLAISDILPVPNP